MHFHSIFIFALNILSLNPNPSQSLKVASIFTDNMMLQCDSPIPIWGQTKPDTKVIVMLNDETYYTKSNKSGEWKVQISSHICGASATIKVISEGQEKKISNIIFGDIWLCGGQSNMEWFFEASDHAEQEINNVENASIRLLEIPHQMSSTPDVDFKQKLHWNECNKNTVKQFSAVGYYFGKYLNQNLSTPIGLISNNFGGTVVEAWTSKEGFEGLPKYLEDIRRIEKLNFEDEKRKSGDIHTDWMSKFYKNDLGIKDSTYIWADPTHLIADWKTMSLPRYWETSDDTMLRHMDGVVWFSRQFSGSNDQDAILSLGPIDDSDMVWINGTLIGQTFNRFNKDRVYDIPAKVLKNGINTITVRIEDYTGGGGISGPGNKMYVLCDGIKTPLSGDWKYKIGYLSIGKMPEGTFSPNNYPTCLYNGMIAPLKNFPIKGIIWYQGESNSYRAYEYRDLFQRFIKDTRDQFNNENLPFLYVQLANFYAEDKLPVESQWAELREAQHLALKLPYTSMITAIDIGDATNIHPGNKKEVGKRLALAALEDVYQKPQNYKSPRLNNVKFVDNHCIVCLDDTGDGLKTDDKFGYIYGFTLASDDKLFHWAKAELFNKQCVKVWSDKVVNPVAVRYSWQNNPSPANLKNSYDFPCLPFRSDDWPISTQNIKRYDE